MEQKKKKNKFIAKLKRRFKLAIINADTYHENWSVKINRFHVLAAFLVFTALIVVITVLVIGYTPLNQYVYGYPTGTEREMLIENHQRITKLYNKINQYEQWTENINNILSGKVKIPDDSEDPEHKTSDSINYNDLDFSVSKEEMELRNSVEGEIRNDISIEDDILSNDDISGILFFPPIKGLVTNRFNPAKNQYGIDIVAAKSNVISSTLDGTVIMDSWTLETGYVIQIQHDNNLISVYKHNAELLKSTGTRVKAGEAIAIFGNTGKYSTGPHLHFELWHNGTPIDPEKFILF